MTSRAIIVTPLLIALLAASPLQNVSLTPTRVGPIALGMTAPAIATAAHAKFVGSVTPSQCEYRKLAGVSGVNFMFSRGKLVRLDVKDKSIRTAPEVYYVEGCS